MSKRETAKSQKLGRNTSSVEVLNISGRGLWILANEREYFLSHRDFPWFKAAKVEEICNVQLIHERHLHWPDLDVDLNIDSFENLESYPLIHKS